MIRGCGPVKTPFIILGYVNNLPADIMHKRGAKHILAVDVGATDEVCHVDRLDGMFISVLQTSQ